VDSWDADIFQGGLFQGDLKPFEPQTDLYFPLHMHDNAVQIQ